MRHASSASVLALPIGVVPSAFVAVLVAAASVAYGLSPAQLAAAVLAVTLSPVTPGAEGEEPLAGGPVATNEAEIAAGIEHHGRELDDATEA